jgi:hypothetical protein
VLVAASVTGCGPTITTSVQRPTRYRAFAEHHGGVELYGGKRQPRLPYDDVGYIKVEGQRNPSRDAMERELRRRAGKLGATAVLNVAWHADVVEEDQTVRVLLQSGACLGDSRFCFFMDDRPRQIKRVVLTGYAVRVRR